MEWNLWCHHSEKAVEVLKKVNVNYFKIASSEVTNHKMLEIIKRTGKKVFLSTGMSSWDEIDRALKILDKEDNNYAMFLNLSMSEGVGLNIITEMKKNIKFQLVFLITI